MATNTTTSIDAKAWHPDVTARVADEEVPEALVLQAGTQVGTVEGDEPSVRVPFISDDGAAGFVPEGEVIPDAAQGFDEAVISTRKIATIARFSREQMAQPGTTPTITSSLKRSIIRSADVAFLDNATAPTGLLRVPGIVDGGTVAGNLDAIADAIAAIEGDGGQATHILAAPGAWNAVSKLKTDSTASNANLLGAGTEAAERRLLSVPVLTASAMPAGGLIVLDRSQVLTAVGGLMIAQSEHALFDSDGIAVRVTWRLGWAVMRPTRVVKLTTSETPAA